MKKDDFYTESGRPKYQYMGIAKRLPIHIKKALEFQEQGDMFNAKQHARAALMIMFQSGYPHKHEEDMEKIIDTKS